MYGLIRPLLFHISRNDPEVAHELVIKLLMQHGNWFSRPTDDERLSQHIWGLTFPNPIGLAAGFDKNCLVLQQLANLGFGFIEGGSVTCEQQRGNPRPRIFRYPADHALINSMGFNSDGAERVRNNLLSSNRPWIPIGLSYGKSASVPINDTTAVKADYATTIRSIGTFADYHVVNVSSPNTPGLRQLQLKEPLHDLLSYLLQVATEIQQTVIGAKPLRKPFLVKVAPDLSEDEFTDVLTVVEELGLEGIIIGNTTISRDGLSQPTDKKGGLSGPMLFSRALEMIKYARARLAPEKVIIGVGGIWTAEHAYDMLRNGADLLQIYTSFVYNGPAVISQINRGLVKLMRAEGYSDITDLRKKRDK